MKPQANQRFIVRRLMPWLPPVRYLNLRGVNNKIGRLVFMRLVFYWEVNEVGDGTGGAIYCCA